MTIPSFPALVGLSYPIGRAPAWRTIKQPAISGKETRLQLWTYPRYKYEIPVSYLGSGSAGQNQDWQTLMGFFNSVAGSALPFHWNDAYDNAVSGQLLGTGDGVTKSFDFCRTLGGFIEPVQDAVASSLSVEIAGTPTTAYTVLTDANWGLAYGIQFTTAPASAAAITAGFSYNWPCRFDADTAELSNFMFNFWDLKKITFESMKVV